MDTKVWMVQRQQGKGAPAPQCPLANLSHLLGLVCAVPPSGMFLPTPYKDASFLARWELK